MTEFWIDNVSVPFKEGESILQAALAAGIEITHLCEDRLLETNGKCGLCLVEIEEKHELVLSSDISRRRYAYFDGYAGNPRCD